ncbi:MAG: MipA/OmpV family protein [Xanthomonadaceae bacterium]|nr:MipA/OmpV family protein [Xanthomonadaceae bacterium]MDP2184193.1 MipA/OmpV family protein [Xanthomonadales bacterium]MDZ4114739.1 MipA/OmpV family protein [Xanthomonadaceae bacterium]MDZ4379038.1 MipA/OmpV family protein [Xanthomonadaceae bacterium]
MRWMVLVVSCLMVVPTMVLAEDSKSEPGRGRDFVALGLGATPDYLGSNDYQLVPFGFASYRVGDVRYTWQGLSFKADFLELRSGGNWVGGISSGYVPGRHDVDNPLVDLLPDIAGTVEVGAFLGRRFRHLFNRSDSLSVSLGTMADIGGVYSGYTLDLGLDYSTALSKRVRALVNLGAVYASEGFMDTQFGVDERGSVASGLPVFAPDAGIHQVSASAGLNMQLNHRWGVFGQVAYTRLTGDARDSPVVRFGGDPDQWRVGLALSYRLD